MKILKMFIEGMINLIILGVGVFLINQFGVLI